MTDILTIGAHNDDYLIGAGGTLSKYKKEGKEFFNIVFSYGEMSHPHLKKKISVQTRVKESLRGDKILGGSGIAYLGLDEGQFMKEENKEKAINTIIKLIKEKKPNKIFTHSVDDPHPDHIAVISIVKEVLEQSNFKGQVYSFDVWNLFRLRRIEEPQLVVDVKDTFEKKIKAFKVHKSQRMVFWLLTWQLYLKAYLNGRKHGYKYCEVFNKIQ